MAFELNSKSIFNYHNYHLYDWAIPLYQSLGGEVFSLGSDAHKAEDHKLKFEQSINLLKKHNVKEVALFKNQNLERIDLDEIVHL